MCRKQIGLYVVKSDTAFQGGFADLPALDQLVLGDASSIHVGILPQVLSGPYERAVWRQSKAEVLPKVVH